MKLALPIALGAAPGCVVLAFAAAGVRVAPGWYHPVDLVMFSFTVVAMGLGVLIWATDKVVASRWTARLRALLAWACGFAAGLVCTAAAVGYVDPCDDAWAVIWLLPYPVLAAAVLARQSRSAS